MTGQGPDRLPVCPVVECDYVGPHYHGTYHCQNYPNCAACAGTGQIEVGFDGAVTYTEDCDVCGGDA